MKQALAVSMIAVVLLILMTQHVNSFTAALAKSVKSSEKPTFSDCRAAVGMPSTGISITLVAACLSFYPNDFKKGEGGTLDTVSSDSSGGVDPFKKSR